jgi:hypothetical protein
MLLFYNQQLVARAPAQCFLDASHPPQHARKISHAARHYVQVLVSRQGEDGPLT